MIISLVSLNNNTSFTYNINFHQITLAKKQQTASLVLQEHRRPYNLVNVLWKRLLNEWEELANYSPPSQFFVKQSTASDSGFQNFELYLSNLRLLKFANLSTVNGPNIKLTKSKNSTVTSQSS